MRIRNLILFALAALFANACYESGNDAALAGQTGQGGSMARFAIQGNYLYIVDRQKIQVFNIAANEFSHLNDVEVDPGLGLETIFAKDDYLYLGASSAMHIYSIADRAKPQFVFRYEHLTSCDPVVVQGTTAYVTLRSGENRCSRGVNLLEILDISDPYYPNLLASYEMESPHGLAVDGDCLFLCEGNSGLKVYDVKDPWDISLITHVGDIFAYDVIARAGLLTVTGEDGIFQYQYNCEQKELSLLSKIPVLRGEL